MGSRLGLSALIKKTLKESGVSEPFNVYFQPPSTKEIKYPCIIYSRINIKVDTANNNPYIMRKQYRLMVIDTDPDSPIPDNVALLPRCNFVNHYTKDNLNHDIYDIYY